LRLPHPRYPGGEHIDDVHVIGVIEGTVYDFAARQFGDDYPVPYTWKMCEAVEELRREASGGRPEDHRADHRGADAGIPCRAPF
jgi:hypothetical protein